MNELTEKEKIEKLKEVKEKNAELEFQRLQANLIFSRLFEDETEGLFSGRNFPLLIITILQIITILILFFKK